ncbi:uncharacterized protein LOC107371007 isoform X1 [Tetranychus urticae]|uniref:uncharacterized protein LOC107371007 isoform X1 n=1 Tax=Tetranychus urticae TaxID=32264 RepID=UPI00077B8E49|nr:uncharacterized protein LOC107371007 isoform X1 [Tetranychus urticae]
MAKKVTFNQIEWPVEVMHSAKIDGKMYDKVRAEWYSKQRVVYDDGRPPLMVDRDPETYTIEELKKQTLELRAEKRGKVTHQCPWCFRTFPLGRSDLAKRHLNGDARRRTGCTTWKVTANEDCSLPSTRRLISFKNK